MDSKDDLDASKVEELLNSLFLPKLKYDLDSVPIENELFADYQANVEESLPLLFDIVQQQKLLIYENEKLHSTLILLLCELAPATIFQVKNEKLLKNVNRLLDVQQELKTSVEMLIFDYYRDKLKQDAWKRHLGAVHGFVHFLEGFFSEKSRNERKLEGGWINFSLSVALNIRDCHETTYKQLGIKIFVIVLKRAPAKVIRELNVQSVMYESMLKDVHSTDSTAVVTNIWNCLLLCLDFFEEMDSISWSKVDDLLEILLRNIPLTNDVTISACLLTCVTKLCTFFTLNRSEINQYIEVISADTADLEACRIACISNTSYTNFRWAKGILETIIFECHKLMADKNTFVALLTAMHKCYLAAILPIPIGISEPHLIGFYEKFTAVLMEAIVVHKKQTEVIKASRQFLDTFIWQLKHKDSIVADTQLGRILEAFEELSQNKVFVDGII